MARAAIVATTIVVLGMGAHATQSGDDPRFDVLEFVIEGNSVLPAIDIERAVYPQLGEGRTIKNVEQAREALEKAYQSAGYLTVLVDIPEQSVDGGIVRLRVTEGRVERLKVRGSRYYSLGRIRAQATELAEGNVPYFPQVQEQLAELNRSADRKVTPVLRPSRTPGGVEVELKVEDSLPLHGSVEITDRYSADTSRWRLAASVRYDNLFQRGHSIGINAQTAPERSDEVKVLSASYLLPLDSGRLLSLYAVRSKSQVASIGTLNVLGNAKIGGARLVMPLPSGARSQHSLMLGIDYKDIGEDINLAGGQGIRTPISYAPLVAQYSGGSQEQSGSATQYAATLTLGVRGLFGNNDAEFENKRFRASANFFALRADWQRTQTLANRWQWFGRLEGQFAGQPLVSNEQYAAGGADSVRGYLESERLGDHALRATIELRSPPLGADGSLFSHARSHVFLDAAALRLIDPQPEQQARFTLSSAGFGVRLRQARGLTLDVDWATALKEAQSTRRSDNRWHLRVGYEF